MGKSASLRSRTLRELVAVLDTAGLGLHHAGAYPELALSSPVILDPLEPLPAAPGGILLGVGLAPAEEATADVIREAANRGYAVVVLRSGPDGTARKMTGSLGRVAARHGIAVLVVEGEISWRHLDTLLESALGAVAEAGDAPTALGAGDLFALANAIAAMVGGATTIENLQEEVLAYSTLPDQPIDEDRQRGILGRQVPYLPENAAQYAEVFRSRGAVRIRGVGEAMDRLAIAVRAGAQPIGSIWVVDARGDLPEESASALERSADIAALHLLQARSSNDLARQRQADGLRRLLEGDAEAPLVARTLNLAPQGPIAVLAFHADVAPGAEAVALSRLVDLVSTQCESQRRGTPCVLLDGTIYAVLTGQEPGQERSVAALARRVIDRASASLRLTLRAALGAGVESVTELAASRRSADQVLLLLATMGRRRDYATAAEVHSRLTLLEVGGLLTATAGLMSPAALAMAEHDRAHGTDYVRTLRCHLDFLSDTARTAAALSLHQNSLRYRLRRVEELFGVDLENADDVLVLWLSLRALDPGPE